jgi:hypothetical protein
MPVETYEWIDTSKMSHAVANFARAQILIALFDGDPDKWIEFLRSEGTAEELENDLPWALGMKRRLAHDPTHLHRLREMLDSFSGLLV